MTANKNLLAQIEDALARDNANLIAQIFAQVDQRLATMEGKLERLLAEQQTDNCATKEQEKNWALDRRMDALDREQLELMQELKAFLMQEVKALFAFVDAKMTQMYTLLAQRPPPDPSARSERPN